MAMFMLLYLEHNVKFMTGFMPKARYRRSDDTCLMVQSQHVKTWMKTSQAAMNLCWIRAFVSCDDSDFDLVVGALKADSVCHGTMD